MHSFHCQMIRKLMSCIDYRRKVFTNLKQRLNTKCQTCDTTHRDHSSANTVESDDHQMPHLISLSVELQSMDHYLVIDKIWNRCLQELVTIRFRVEESFSWLSTLGGAYSSLGEYDITFAIKAGQISKSQLLLASITGDPNIVAKCGVFMAYSLCQQHRQPEAIQLIRRTLHPFIIRIEFCEQTVKSMFSALCYRIKHYYK
ncbi:unnamed protein product [Oppiella nova]|uniref:Uncharacterized protein n=1 Tax=Oppiella nova TaxID=334625 RepID=A0A7R9QCC7_9ACAR|nr:unnamed protein product [Oppiella nova]CAG2163086.1 unnamed protein product [Oppiella nova]